MQKRQDMGPAWYAKFKRPKPLLGTLFWLHGTETEDELRQAFRNAVDSGVGELVLESRPHWDYLGPKWWKDLKLLLRWAAEENINVILFDEKWYPSGVAGDTIQKLDPEFQNVSIRYQSIRYRGPQANVSIMPPWTSRPKSRIIGAFAYPSANDGRIDWEASVDLTGRLHSDVSLHMHGIWKALRWDVPEGDWTVVFIIADRSSNYIDPMNPRAVEAFIDRVYESSKQQLSEYFGKPLTGFFFDEPGFFTPYGKFPWSPYVHKAFIEQKGYDPLPYLALLWLEKDAHPFKHDFFEVLNRCFAETFHKPMQEWCHRHNLRYIGHWYEHEACPGQGERFMFHEGFGEGVGDFFEVSKYADEGGIDVVCNQVLPGEQNRDYFGLPKLGSSAAHVYNLQDDLAMSETFGAYGWHIGLKTMKWLTDWQAVRGINHYVLHAFNPKDPDLDCPPYFYDGGRNPQWPYFPLYAAYVNRISSLLRGGKHIAPLLVLYPGAGGQTGRVFPTEDTQRFLQELQYDYDLVSAELLQSQATITHIGTNSAGAGISLHKETYEGLIISGQEVVTEALLNTLLAFAEANVPILFLYQAPSVIVSGTQDDGQNRSALQRLLEQPSVSVVESHSLLEQYLLNRHGIQPEISFTGAGRDGLRTLHRIMEDGTPIWYVNNESVEQTVVGHIRFKRLPQNKTLVALEPFTGEMWLADDRLVLPPYRSLLFIAADAAELPPEAAAGRIPPAYRMPEGEGVQIPRETIRMNWPASGRETEVTGLPSWLTLDPHFSGTVEYHWEWEFAELPASDVVIDLGEVHEIAELEVNGSAAGLAIVPPYRFDIKPLLKLGTNHFRARVTNVVSNSMRTHRDLENIDPQWSSLRDMHSIVEESGLLGPITIFFQSK